VVNLLLVGEALVGEGNEVAHIDVIIGEKNGPVGYAFSIALADQKAGHTNLLAIVAPNLPAKPSTVIIPKVTMKNLKQAELMFGPAQEAVARGVLESVKEGVIPKGKVEDLCIVCSVFIHPLASDKKKIYEYNLLAVKEAIKRAFSKQPTIDEILSKMDTVKHPFRGF